MLLFKLSVYFFQFIRNFIYLKLEKILFDIIYPLTWSTQIEMGVRKEKRGWKKGPKPKEKKLGRGI